MNSEDVYKIIIDSFLRSFCFTALCTAQDSFNFTLDSQKKNYEMSDFDNGRFPHTVAYINNLIKRVQSHVKKLFL